MSPIFSLMTKEELLFKAINIATEAHRGQTDKYGAPYIGHVMRVVNYCRTLDEKIIGALHDVVEDAPDWTFERLTAEGFGAYVYELDCLTKREGEDYDIFLSRTLQSELAVRVKLCDLQDNMDLRRVNRALAEKDLKRMNKYLKAYRYLTEKY